MLLISYNVNVEGDGARQWTTDYHPRFLWLDLDPDNDVDLDSENADFVEQSSSEYNPALAVIAIVTVVIAIGTGVCFAWVKK